jgi:sugar transferase (PEP-CTERM/EpsH1 system associated)
MVASVSDRRHTHDVTSDSAIDRRGPSSPPARTRIRVMHLILRLSVGGLEGGVLKLVNGFDRTRFSASICHSWQADSVLEHLSADVPLFEIDKRRYGNDPLFLFRLASLLRRERPHILHTHNWGTLAEGFAAARLAGVPVVVHGEHGTMHTKWYGVQRAIWSRLDGVLSVSRRLSETMSAQVGFPLDRIQTIHNGVDSVRFSPALRASARELFGVAPSDFVVGHVGRLEAVKDQAGLVAALGLLRQRGRPFRALIAGGGSLRGALESQSRSLGLEDQLTFLGARLDVQNVMAAFDTFVLSSTSEGLSNTILEAMASGVPVVATDVGGARELVVPGETGLIVPPADPARLADAIDELGSDLERRARMSRNARDRATTTFGLDTMIRNYEAFYEKLVARSSGPLPDGVA